MRTLTVSIDDADFTRLGLRKERVSFSELKEKLSIEYAREALAKCQEIAGDVGLANMTLDEIDAEIRAARDERKNRH